LGEKVFELIHNTTLILYNQTDIVLQERENRRIHADEMGSQYHCITTWEITMAIIQFNLIYLHANLTAKGQLQSEHVKKI
jgi:protein associated with RNAse G/E